MVRTEEEMFLILAALDAIHLLEDERFTTPEGMMEHRGALAELVQDILIHRD